MMRLMTVTTEVNYFRMTLASIAKVVMKVFIKKSLTINPPTKWKKTPLLHRIMWIYKQVILIIFFAILSILLQMLPMRLSGGTGVCISLTLYNSVCELMMVQRQQQQQHTHTHTRTRTHTHTHTYAHASLCVLVEHAHAQVKVRQIYTIT